MNVLSVHDRDLATDIDTAAAVLATTGQPGCRLSPATGWPPDMRIHLDGPVAEGVTGGHGGVRYEVTAYEPGRRLEFRFLDDMIDGGHRFELHAGREGDRVRIVHTLAGTIARNRRPAWAVIRRFHDAYVEVVLDSIEVATTGRVARPSRPPRWMRLFNTVESTRQRWSANRPIARLAGVLVPVTVAGIGGLHLAWAFGSSFPAGDERRLAEWVIGWTSMPPRWASAVVGVGLVSAAGALAATVAGNTARAVRVGALLATVAIGLRGVLGPLDSLGRVATTYGTANLALYTPLCLALGAGAMILVSAAAGRTAAAATSAPARVRGSAPTVA